MSRMYFLVPEIEETAKIVQELQELGLQRNHIHVASKHHASIHKAHLPEATLLHTTDFVNSLKRGAIVGGGAGILAGLVALAFPPLGIEFNGLGVIGLGIFGAGFGAWSSSMIGVSIPDVGIERFHDALENGDYLVMLDLTEHDKKEEEIRAIIHSHHPNAAIENADECEEHLPNQ